MSDRLSEIEARLKAARPGPWAVEIVPPKGAYEGGYNIETPGGCKIAYDVFAGAIDDPDDAALIANAPSDLAYLLAELRKAREENEMLRAAWGITPAGKYHDGFWAVEGTSALYSRLEGALCASVAIRARSASRPAEAHLNVPASETEQ